MRETKIKIRVAQESDAYAISKIYAPYVQDTAISFEYIAPSASEMTSRIADTLERYPWIVAEIDGAILGYAYTSPFVERAAYDWVAKTSIYIDMQNRGQGIGGALYQRLEEISREQGIVELYACIAKPGEMSPENDAHVNNSSINFHAHMGYVIAGEFPNCGYKFDEWYSMVWMRKQIAKRASKPSPFIPFSELWGR